MQARDVMVSPVITVRPDAKVKETAKLLLERHISAVPVVSETKIVGIVSEGDLFRRAEIGTQKHRNWLLRSLASDEALAAEYVRLHSRYVSDVMTRHVITASPDTPLHEVADLLERNGIKRVPIVSNGELVGIVSRTNLIQVLASLKPALALSLADAKIRDELLKRLNAERWAHLATLNVIVNNGVVDLWGAIQSNEQRNALRVAAETTPGVQTVNDYLFVPPAVSL